MESRATRVVLILWVIGVLLFLFVPIATIIVFAFDRSNVQSWPIDHYTTHRFTVAWHDEQVRQALWLSVKAGLAATVLALVLGSLASFAVHRFHFFGREAVSLLLVLPLALPGIITGIALQSFFNFNNVTLSLMTIIIGHTTFCIVVIYNNVIARLRRVSANMEEASADLGAHTWQTFRHITLPNMQTALVAGALLAFALSFDEIIVTTFTLGGGQQTLPVWILDNLFRGQQLPITNVVAVIVVLLSIIPVYFAHRLTREESISARGGGAAGPAESAVVVN
jgi:putative spermidine/putrescine transport system permease protein